MAEYPILDAKIREFEWSPFSLDILHQERFRPPFRLAPIRKVWPSLRLHGADLRRTCFKGASLKHSGLLDADFQGADLRGANLLSSTIERMNLQDILTDKDTRIPRTSGLGF